MKGMSYLWRMALRRKAACLLVVISTAVATVFMLFYPSLIENTRQRLDETYLIGNPEECDRSTWLVSPKKHNHVSNGG